MLKHRHSLQKSLRPVVLCPYLCSSEGFLEPVAPHSLPRGALLSNPTDPNPRWSCITITGYLQRQHWQDYVAFTTNLRSYIRQGPHGFNLQKFKIGGWSACRRPRLQLQIHQVGRQRQLARLLRVTGAVGPMRTWAFITGGCSGRGVQWIGVVLCNKLVYSI